MDASAEWTGGSQSPLGESLLPCTSAFLVPGQEDVYLRDSQYFDGRTSVQGLNAGYGSPGQLMGATWPTRHASAFAAPTAFPGQSQYPADPPLQPSASPAQEAAQYHQAGQLSPENPTLLAALDLAPAAASASPAYQHSGGAPARSPGGGPMNLSAASSPFHAQGAGGYGMPPQPAEAWGAYQQQVRASQQALDARFAVAAAAGAGGGGGASPSPPVRMAAAPIASPMRASQPLPSQYAQHQARSSLQASLAEPYMVTTVEQLRTSPLPSGVSESPALGGPRSGGGAGQGGSSGGDKGASSQRYQAQILSLERQNAELQKRLADVQAALEAAQQGRHALEAKNDMLLDEVAQAKSDAKARESALETARRANDAMSTELRGVQEELSSARDALAEAKDTAVQWQDRAMEAAKELDASRRKIETLGEEERRLSAENMVLRKDVQQLNDAIIKGRIETSELRDKLRQAQQEGARATSEVHMLASRAESEQESAAVQLVLMRNRVAELEARNSQMVFDLAAAREESVRARQAAEATKAALAAKPAGIISELGPASRHYGTLSQAWLGTEGTGGAPTSAADRRPAVGSGSSAQSAEVYAPASTTAAVLRELPRDVAFSKLDPETFRSMVRAEAEALARASGGRTAASHDAGGHGTSAYDAGPHSPPPPRYGGYGSAGASADALAAEASSGSVASGLPAPSSHPAWAAPQSYADNNRQSYDSKPYDSRSYEAAKPYEVRDSLAAMLPDPRSSWVASLAEARNAPGYGDGPGAYGARTGAAGAGQRPPLPPSAGTNQQQSPGPTSPPPPYAIHTADSSYAYRRPPNAVGAGAAAGVGGGSADSNTPFGTEDTSKALLARSKALEDQLMVLCAEKGGLEAEYARMPLGAGRSLRERNRKAVVEQRLELLNKEISAVRMQLKRIGLK